MGINGRNRRSQTAATGTARLLSGPAIVFYLAAAKVLFHIATSSSYGIFRDELYYLACSEHLDWGYVDQPPLIALIAWIARHVFGESLIGLRLIPAFAAGATVWLTGKLSREIGGGDFAQVLAALAVIATSIFLIMHHWLTMNAFEPLIWIGCALCIVQAINRNDSRYWIWFGLLVGLGMENKYTMGFFVFAVVVGLAVTRDRQFLATRPFWIGFAIAFAMFLPNLIWLIRHDFPFLELMHNIRQTHRDVVRSPVAFFLDQIAIINPVLLPIWLGGLIWLLLPTGGARFRVLGVIYVVMLVTFITLRGKNYYLAPIYPMLFGAGAVAFESITETRWRWSRAAYLILIIGSTVVLLPTVAPLLFPQRAVAYQRKLGLESPKAENQPTGPLPQYFADEFGWEQMATETARIYSSLPADERARTAIFANNYGEAGAIDFFGPRLGLPKAICNHQSYWLWGPRGYNGSTVIVLGSDGRGDREHFRSVEIAGRSEHSYSRRDEHFDILLCRGLKVDLRELWKQIKKYN